VLVLIKTGIRGLDSILSGIPRTNVILLQRVIGSGKTVMGGISLVPLEKRLAPASPLQSYSSLLGRAPTRFSLPKRTNGTAVLQDNE
jgi:hypothetical protein